MFHYIVSVFREEITPTSGVFEEFDYSQETETIISREKMSLEEMLNQASGLGLTSTSSSDGSGWCHTEFHTCDLRSGSEDQTTFHYEVYQRGQRIHSLRMQRRLNKLLLNS